ncbi:MAG: hypothetical protein KAQ98_08740 [Bacteriovoracaceae bacterium]|nr:hypothetical protein [Bacteriovoracaceae bacterium]
MSILNALNIIFVIILLCKGTLTFAFEQYFGTRLIEEIKYLDQEEGLSCPKGLVLDRERFDSIEEKIEKMDFSPKCIWDTIKKKNAERLNEKILGFSWGTTMEASSGIGVQIGTEIIFMPIDDRTAMIGAVKYEGASFSFGLSGVSLTQSIVFGDCKDNIFGYLGWFKSWGFIAMTKTLGAEHPFKDNSETGCNMITSTRGMTSPVLTVSRTYYKQLGQFIMVEGPRVQPLIDYIYRTNAEKGYNIRTYKLSIGKNSR